jgi:MoCo/4Fe-4S cofactor protein with predicted Tat translocation signal
MAERLPLDLDALRAQLQEQRGIQLWRSLEELVDWPEMRRHIETEFPDIMQAGAVDRRTLLRLMGASLALGGLAACNSEQEAGNKPLFSQAYNAPGYTPGVPAVFATSVELNGYGRGVLVKAQEGRPIKIEGNPLHPASGGATDVFAQAEILSLYDPDRSAVPLQNGLERSWEDVKRFAQGLHAELLSEGGSSLHVLLPPTTSPTLNRLASLAQERLPGSRWHRFSPVDEDNRREGAILVFGRALDPVYDLNQSDVVVTLGGDLFSEEPGHIRYASDYQARRRVLDRGLPFLTAVESRPSLVGARADERLVLRPRDLEPFVHGLASALEAATSPPGEMHPAAIKLAERLHRAGARGLVVAGREQPARVHALAFSINARIGALGTTIRMIDPVRPASGEVDSLVDLVDEMVAGRVSRLLILGGNPAYNAPADLDFASLLPRVPLSIHLGYQRDETASLSRWHIPESHPLEGWGDLRAFDGTVGLRQPATVPLRPGLGAEELLGMLLGEAADGRTIVQAVWRERWGEAFEDNWERALELGIVENSAFPPVEIAAHIGWDMGPSGPASDGSIDVLFAPDPSVWDGRFANNGWLQELPKPLTKQVWGNAALIALETAASLGLSTGDAIDLTVEGAAVRAPVWVLPGHAPETATLPLGYGRARAGSIGNGIGFNAYAVRRSGQHWIARGVVKAAGERIALISTQHHHDLQGRDIVRVTSPDTPANDPVEVRPSLYPEWPYEGHAWGMTIDLDACIGCNACIIGCQAENNVAIVGPEEAARGREMHWLRIDRYYAGDPAYPKTYFQPVLCMHCENAPCEIVCPVNATVHSAEGLNDMVYNRCIGTRTCSNNCPYKVRRFNFFSYQNADYAASREAMNPQVTVRERGVMEKCTFCVQRISAARIDARIENRSLRDGEILTACQQACPTQAITFGDINDSESAVSRSKRSSRNYALLGPLNTRPRTTYLARIEAEPAANPAIPDKD